MSKTTVSLEATEKKDKGFTLVELLVVIVIIGILAAIAIPLFLNQREKAAEAGLKSDLKNMATLIETEYIDTQTYSTTQPADAKVDDKNNFVITLLDDGQGFCIAGTNDDYADADWWYDSTEGGLTQTAC